MPIEKKSVYVKIERDEAVESKRMFLESEESIINSLIITEEFSRLCSDESRDISHLRARYSDIIAQINVITGSLPKEEKEEMKKEERTTVIIKGKSIKELSKEDIRTKELQEIKERISRLGGK